MTPASARIYVWILSTISEELRAAASQMLARGEDPSAEAGLDRCCSTEPPRLAASFICTNVHIRNVSQERTLAPVKGACS
jgi:hypothetical protein